MSKRSPCCWMNEGLVDDRTPPSVSQMEMHTKESERMIKRLQLEVRKEAAVSSWLQMRSLEGEPPRSVLSELELDYSRPPNLRLFFPHCSSFHAGHGRLSMSIHKRGWRRRREGMNTSGEANGPRPSKNMKRLDLKHVRASISQLYPLLPCLLPPA